MRPLSRRKEAKGPVGPAAEPKERRETSETREAREPSEPRETRETRETSDARDSKDPAPEDAAVEATQESSETSRPQEEPPEPNESKDERSPESSRSGPMDAVLYMRGPAIEPPSANRTHPPMPFTHYFDTYQMVNRLTDAKFQRGQAVTTMKAVRSLLGGKMEEAQKTLVSKGDVDNVGLLFPSCHFPVACPQKLRPCQAHLTHLTFMTRVFRSPHYSLSYPFSYPYSYKNPRHKKNEQGGKQFHPIPSHPIPSQTRNKKVIIL